MSDQPTAAAPIWPYPHRTVQQMDGLEYLAKMAAGRMRQRVPSYSPDKILEELRAVK